MFGARRAAENFEKVEKMLHLVGVEKQRVRLEQISAAESQKFANVVTEMITQVKDLGPNPLRTQSDSKEEIEQESSLIKEAKL